jgi:hypothetical protein
MAQFSAEFTIELATIFWHYFGNSFGTSNFFGEFICHFSFTQTQVYTLSLRGDVKNIILDYFSIFFIFLYLFFFYPNSSLHIEFEGDVKNIILGYLLLLYVY